MYAEFKEKTYEKYFGHELARRTNVTFSPDQCDEAFLGFDDAFFLHWEFLLDTLPYRRRRRSSRLRGLLMSELDALGDEISRRLPPFKFNLFVQYKRPEYLSRASAAEWSCWQRAYFRYETTPHQHALLAKIDQKSHGRAATVYAAPAFWRSDDLWRHVEAESVFRQSNIASVGRLNGHSRFSYLSAGCIGKGHSDPVDIESPSIERLLELGLGQDSLPFNRHIKRAAQLLNEVVESDHDATIRLSQARSALLGREAEEASIATTESLSYALVTIEAFSAAFDISFFAIG